MRRLAIVVLACVVAACSRPATHSYGAAPAVAFPASWLVANWYIDPQSAVATCSDSNTGTDSLHPICHWYELATRWAGIPNFQQNTTITFQSSHTNGSDPVNFEYNETGGFYAAIVGVTPTAAATGTMTVSTAKSYASNTLLNVGLTSGLIAGQLFTNNTRNSIGWLYANTSGNNWNVSQQIAPTGAPPGTNFPAEVDTSASTDAYSVYSLVNVNIVRVASHIYDYNLSTFNNLFFLYRLRVWDPHSGAIPDDVEFSLPGLYAREVGFDRFVRDSSVDSNQIGTIFTNCDFPAGGHFNGIVTTRQFWAGQNRKNTTSFTFGGLAMHLEGDFIVGQSNINTGAGKYGSVYLDTGVTWTAGGLIPGTVNYSLSAPAAKVWGPGTVNASGNTRFAWPNTQTAVSTFVNAGGIQLNGQSTACSLNGSTINCGISITPTNLDAAAGVAGFGGLAFLPGGASVVKVAAANY